MEVPENQYQKLKTYILKYQLKNREKHLEYMREYQRKIRQKKVDKEKEQIIQEYLISLIKK